MVVNKTGYFKNSDDFLRWMLEELNLSWQGYRKVRGQVHKRIRRRMEELSIVSFDRYRQYLEKHTDEWEMADRMARITISRFYRDSAAWDSLKEIYLPAFAETSLNAGRSLRCWSAGCASGEEPYSLAILWKQLIMPRFPQAKLEIVATDADDHMLGRAEKACYSRGPLRDLPVELTGKAFEKEGISYCLKEEYKEMVKFLSQDIRKEMPEGKFDLVFCKNLVSMYFRKSLAVSVFSKISKKMRKGSLLILGNHEEFPLDEIDEIKVLDKGRNMYIRK